MPIELVQVDCTTVRSDYRIALNRTQLRALLSAQLVAQGGTAIPDDASLYFHVPGGADWSHCDIDIDDDNPVLVTWTRTETNEELS